MIRAGQGAAQDDAAFQLINPAEWESFTIALAEDAPAVMAAAFEVMRTQAHRNRLALFLAASVATGAIVASEVANNLVELAPKLKFAGGDFGDPPEDTDEPSETSSACNPEATRDKDSVCVASSYPSPAPCAQV